MYSDRGRRRRGARLLHVCSPFELDVPISRLWPAAAATRGHAAGGHALRPDPRDLRRALPRRSRVCGGATGPGSSSCARPTSCSRSPRPPRATRSTSCTSRRSGSWWSARRRGRLVRAAGRRRPRRCARRAAAVRGLEERFVLYTAGMDDRKNFQGLFRAWGRAAGGGARRLAARDGVQHGRPDAQSPRAPRARGRASRRDCCCPASCPTRCCGCCTSRPICSCSRRSTRATGCRSRRRSRAARARSVRARRRSASCSFRRRSSIRPTTTRSRARSSARSPTTRHARVLDEQAARAAAGLGRRGRPRRRRVRASCSRARARRRGAARSSRS